MTVANANLDTLSKHWKFVANQNKSPYLIEGWEVSSSSTVFLDTELFRGLRWKTLSKVASSHPKWVHTWWFFLRNRTFTSRSTPRRAHQNQEQIHPEAHEYHQKEGGDRSTPTGVPQHSLECQSTVLQAGSNHKDGRRIAMITGTV